MTRALALALAVAVALVGSIAIAVVLSACPASQSQRCRDVCRRMVKCIETLDRKDIAMDENECTTTCTALERDSDEGKKRVDEHVQCVSAADGKCEAILACQ